MTAKELISMCYKLEDDEEVEVLNENAPVKGATPIKTAFTLSEHGARKKLILMYESKNGKEGNR